jgi:hypothetical protein
MSANADRAATPMARAARGDRFVCLTCGYGIAVSGLLPQDGGLGDE